MIGCSELVLDDDNLVRGLVPAYEVKAESSDLVLRSSEFEINS